MPGELRLIKEEKIVPLNVQAVKEYQIRWETLYSERFFPQRHHFIQTAGLFRTEMGFDPPTMEEVTKRLNFFFSCNWDWVVGCRHNLSKFCEYFNKWVEEAKYRPPQVKRKRPQAYCQECHTNFFVDERCKCL